jgi:outer membrane protein assembly factor BamB
VWGSTVIVDDKVFLGNEDGTLTVFKHSSEKAEVLAEIGTTNYSSIYSTPTFANGKLFLSDRARIYCIDVQAGK